MEKLAIINIYIGLIVLINFNGRKALRGYLLSFVGISSLISNVRVEGNQTDLILLNLLFVLPVLILLFANRLKENFKKWILFS